MDLRHIALVSEESSITFSELTTVSASLQKQVMRDFSPIWEINATVDAFHRLDDVPVGTWPIIIMDDIHEEGAAGIHDDQDGQPIALVQFEDGWPLTASHECLEMLADPFGDRLMSGQSPKPGQGRVQFLVEVCDPSEDASFAYTINGVQVSDFYTPHYFDPVKNPTVKYSFTNSIKNPRQVLKNGYLSWKDPITGRWFQETRFGPRKFVTLGALTSSHESLRTQINKMTPEAHRFGKPTAASLQAVRRSQRLIDRSEVSKADAWRAQIAALKLSAGPRTNGRSRKRGATR